VAVAGTYAVSTLASSPILPGYWLNGTWTDLPLPSGMTEGVTTCIALSGTTVYVGGSVDDGSGVTTPGYWAGGAWVGLTVYGATAEGVVTSLYVSGGDVYAAASAPATTGPVFGYWFDGNWTTVTAPPSGQGMFGNLIPSGGETLLAGAITEVPLTGPTSTVLGYWLSGTWVPVATSGRWSGTAPLAVAGSSVYLATGLAGYYQNGVWVDLSPVLGTSGVISSLMTIGNEVYAFGTSSGNSGYVLNGLWNVLPAGVNANGPYALAQGEVYACGTAPSGTASQAGYWFDGSWTVLPPPPTAALSTLAVTALAAQ